jgi:hypothetical protein
MSMDCRRAEELFSDQLDGSLHPLLRGELERHLAACGDCRRLFEAVTGIVQELRTLAAPAPPAGLAERAARHALAAARPVEIRPALVLPHWLQVAAAGFALIALGTALAVIGPERPTRAAQRLVSQTELVSSALIEHKDRLVEDVRLLGAVLSTAFEGRLEKVEERVEDYKRLLERRNAGPRRAPEPKQGRGRRPDGVDVAQALRTGAAARS